MKEKREDMANTAGLPGAFRRPRGLLTGACRLFIAAAAVSMLAPTGSARGAVDLSRSRQAGAASQPAPSIPPAGANRYVIVYADHLAEVARQWADYRAVQGWVTVMAPVGEIARMNAISGAAQGGTDGGNRSDDEIGALNTDAPTAAGPDVASTEDDLATDANAILPRPREEVQAHPVAWAIQRHLRAIFAEAHSEGGVAPEWFHVLLLGDAPDFEDDPALVDLHVPPGKMIAEAAAGGGGGEGAAGPARTGESIGPGLAYTTIPAFTVPKTPGDRDYQSLWEPSGIVTDHFYQLADDADAEADFPLGRMPARTVGEARTLLQKVKQYEHGSPPGEWRRTVNFVAGEGRFGQLDRLIETAFIRLVDQMLPPAWDIHMTYAKVDSPYCPAPADLPGAAMRPLTQGALLTNYLGHGSANGLDRMWAGEERFELGDRAAARSLPASTGASGLPILILIACTTGRYDFEDGRPSFGEVLLLNPSGPVAVIAGSRVTHPFGNAVYHKHFTTALLGDRLPTLGQVELRAAQRLMRLEDPEDETLESMGFMLAMTMNWKTTTPEHRRLASELYNLLGDPALRPAYPAAEVVDIRWDAARASVIGRAPEGFGGSSVRVTIEAPRTAIPRAAEMQPVSVEAVAASDPTANERLRRNHAIANDRALAVGRGTVGPDGSFAIPLPVAGVDWSQAAWIKVYVEGCQSNPGSAESTWAMPVCDAFGAAPFPGESD